MGGNHAKRAPGIAQAVQAPVLIKSANAKVTCQGWTCGGALKPLELRAGWTKPSDDRCCSPAGNHAKQAPGVAQAVQTPFLANSANTKETCQSWTCGGALKLLELRAKWYNPSDDRCCSPEGNHVVPTCQSWTCGGALKLLELRAKWVSPSDDRCCSP